MTEQDVKSWLHAYGAAWIEGDPEQAVALFTDTAIYRETPFDAPMKGHENIRAYWKEGAADAQANVMFSSQIWAVSGDLAIAGWQASFRRKASDVHAELDGVFRLTFCPRQATLLCKSLEEWWHIKQA